MYSFTSNNFWALGGSIRGGFRGAPVSQPLCTGDGAVGGEDRVSHKRQGTSRRLGLTQGTCVWCWLALPGHYWHDDCIRSLPLA